MIETKIRWQPSAALDQLRARAKIIAAIREFFANRDVLEVETPLLSAATVTDPHIASLTAQHQHQTLYLQTSPEYAMKRLLAAGSGSIYQICKAFRQGDLSKRHNPEFTMLEWYRIGFDHHALMDEMDELLQLILKTSSAERMSVLQVYEKYVGINPHQASLDELARVVQQKIHLSSEITDRNTWLDLLFTHCIESQIGKERPLFLYDFPASQAALAKIRNENPPIASRFEVYFKGMELANGFHELQDASEQRKRFENELIYRNKNGLSPVPLDEKFLAALDYGLPNCSGVALGIDRLIMLALNKNNIADVVSFPFERV